MNAHLHSDIAATGSISGRPRRRRSLWKAPALTAAFLVAIPLVASRLIADWHWHPAAFVILWAMIFGLGFVYELITRNHDAIAYRAAVGLAFGAGFMQTWGNVVQMADVNPAAGLFFGVPLVGLGGAAWARLRPHGMARTLFACAIAQAIVLVAAVAFQAGRFPEVSTWTPPEWRGIAGNALTALLFVTSGFLFRKAAREEPAPGAG